MFVKLPEPEGFELDVTPEWQEFELDVNPEWQEEDREEIRHGDRVHWLDDPTDRGVVIDVNPGRRYPYLVRWSYGTDRIDRDRIAKVYDE